MARRAVRTGRAGLAFDLALAAIQANPDYEPARRLFGYQKFRDQWRTLYEVKKLRAGFVWSEKFGWLPKAHLRRYEEGQRYCDGRWISAAEDAERHRDIRSGWDVETEHYTIRTNHSIEAGVALGVKLERLDRLWQQMFIRYFASEADVVALFDGRPKPPSAAAAAQRGLLPRPRRLQPFAAARQCPTSKSPSACTSSSRGGRISSPTSRATTARSTTRPRTSCSTSRGRWRPTWARRPTSGSSRGSPCTWSRCGRKTASTCWAASTTSGCTPPSTACCTTSSTCRWTSSPATAWRRLQKDPRIATLYSQAAGLTNFLVYYDGGRYRDALVSYLVAVYTGRDEPDTLAKLTGANYSDLDKQYHEFIEGGGGEEWRVKRGGVARSSGIE